MKCKTCGTENGVLERSGLCRKCARKEANRLVDLPSRTDGAIERFRVFLNK